MIALIAVAAGLLFGALGGGSPRGLATVRLRFQISILVLFVIQGVARGRLLSTVASGSGMFVWVAASTILVVLLRASFRQTGVMVVAAGVLLNVLVVLANSGMPVLAGGSSQLLAKGAVARSSGFYEVATSSTLGLVVGDVIPLEVVGQTYYLSVGDVLLGVGVAVAIAAAMIGEGQSSAEDAG